MKAVYIICEGSTEERFAKEVLKPHFQPMHLFLKPISLNGGTSYDRLRDAILRQIPRDPQAWVTTMVDLYGMNGKFPGYESATILQPVSKAEFIEAAILSDIRNRTTHDVRFIPYVQLYEFETMLFADANRLEEALQMNKKFKKGTFVAMLNGKPTPEHINDDPITSPSHRITAVMGNSYQKNVDGILIAKEIGLERIRQECPHFNAWIEKLETLANS